LFICYAHANERVVKQIKPTLTVLARRGYIAPWSDTDLIPGEDWDETIKSRLSQARIILFTVSRQFLASDYLTNQERPLAMELLKKKKKALVIPVLLTESSWREEDFSKLEKLPREDDFLTKFNPREDGWALVEAGLIKVIKAEQARMKNNLATSSNTDFIFTSPNFMTFTELEILFEDNHLLVINKPPTLATMGADDAPTAHELACRYVAEKYKKPGRVFLGVVHRLDSMCSGVLVFARTSKAAARLSEQFRRAGSGPKKIYLAAVEGDVVIQRNQWTDWIAKNEQAHRMELASPATEGAVEAKLEYRVLRHAIKNGLPWSLAAVRLMTGRKHQIRVQFAERGHAIVGDVKYGAQRQSLRGIALHAWSLTIDHPTKATPLTFRAAPPKSWGQCMPTEHELALLDDVGIW